MLKILYVDLWDEYCFWQSSLFIKRQENKNALNFSSTSRSADCRGTQTHTGALHATTALLHKFIPHLRLLSPVQNIRHKQQNKQINKGFKFWKQQHWRSFLFCITYRWLYCHTMAKCSNWCCFQSHDVCLYCKIYDLSKVNIICDFF